MTSARHILVACVLTLGATSVVHADAETMGSPEPKSPVVAGLLSGTPMVLGTGLSVGGLIVANLDGPRDYFGEGVALATTGAVLLAVGPSLGHLYNGRMWTTGLKVRIAGASLSALGLGIALLPLDCDGFVCAHQGIGALVIAGGALTLFVGAAIDATSAPNATRERNSSLSLVRLRTSSGDSTPAVMFHTTF